MQLPVQDSKHNGIIMLVQIHLLTPWKCVSVCNVYEDFAKLTFNTTRLPFYYGLPQHLIKIYSCLQSQCEDIFMQSLSESWNQDYTQLWDLHTAWEQLHYLQHIQDYSW